MHEYVISHLNPNQWTYVFIDEIQNCKEYERTISSLYLRKNVDIYITSSNAYMLSGEPATKLAGRAFGINMLPLSFSEYSEAVDTTSKRERFNQFMNMALFPMLHAL
ncbi:MAG TPA: hypothetical protein DDZ89_03840 [Clostridiales bacterium]|nr:hypothetical protein [Clostridiales bacterium]